MTRGPGAPVGIRTRIQVPAGRAAGAPVDRTIRRAGVRARALMQQRRRRIPGRQPVAEDVDLRAVARAPGRGRIAKDLGGDEAGPGRRARVGDREPAEASRCAIRVGGAGRPGDARIGRGALAGIATVTVLEDPVRTAGEAAQRGTHLRRARSNLPSAGAVRRHRAHGTARGSIGANGGRSARRRPRAQARTAVIGDDRARREVPFTRARGVLRADRSADPSPARTELRVGWRREARAVRGAAARGRIGAGCRRGSDVAAASVAVRAPLQERWKRSRATTRSPRIESATRLPSCPSPPPD